MHVYPPTHAHMKTHMHGERETETYRERQRDKKWGGGRDRGKEGMNE